MSTQSNAPQYEMLWDCKFCGTTKLLGKSQRFCPTCGAAQDPASRYFPSDDEKVAVKDHKYVGADRICPACSATNSAASAFCTQCGAPLENAAQASVLAAQERREGEKFQSSGPRDLAKERMEADLGKARAAEAQKQAAARRPLIVGGVIVAVTAVIALIAFLMSTTSSTVIVAGHSWERTIRIEDYGPRADSAWREGVPSDAYNLTCFQDIRSYRQVPDGEDCRTVRIDQGDGTYREERRCEPRYREEPVYDTRCNFVVDRWAYARTVTASGASLNDTPYWPELNLRRTGTCQGCEREQPGGRQERYVVRLKATDGDQTYECSFSDQNAWAAMSLETGWQMEVRRTGQPVCSSLKPA